MSLTLTAVFAPVAFVPGNTGKLFAEFALTVAAAVAVSGFVALTLTPMMCSKILKEHEKHGGIYLAMERFFHATNDRYRAALGWTLRHKAIPLTAFALVIAGTAATYAKLRHELSPLEDRGYFLTLINAPEGASMEYTDNYVRAVERMYAEGVPEIRSMFAVVAPGLERPNPVNFGVTFASSHRGKSAAARRSRSPLRWPLASRRRCRACLPFR
jgi:multidrug efflux pump